MYTTSTTTVNPGSVGTTSGPTTLEPEAVVTTLTPVTTLEPGGNPADDVMVITIDARDQAKFEAMMKNR